MASVSSHACRQPDSPAAKQSVGQPGSEERRQMTAGAQRHAELLKDKVREANEYARRHADEHVAPAGPRAKRNGDQHNYHTGPRRREPGLQLRVEHRAGVREQIGVQSFVIEDFRYGKLDFFRGSDAAELTDFDFASD